MNPAILNYLQAQQEQMQNQRGQSLPVNMPRQMMMPQQEMQAPISNGDNLPAFPANNMQSYNPFDVGINRAIASARESLSMTDKQRDKALRSSMLTFANNLSQQPKQRGFFANFAAAGRALSPAIAAYDQEENNALQENNNIANQILQYKQAERARLAQEEERAWRRQHVERQLQEQKRYHDMMYGLGSAKLKGEKPAANNGLASELGLLPIRSKTTISGYEKDKKNFGDTLKIINDIEKDYKNFRTKYQDNLIDPTGLLGGVANTTKDYLSRFTGAKELRDEVAARNALNSNIGSFRLIAEKAAKGGNLGIGFVRLLNEQNLYPDLSDSPETLAAKLAAIKEHALNNYKASTLSLKYNAQIDPLEIEKVEDYEQGLSPRETLAPQEELNSFETEPQRGQEEWVIMTNPATGEQYEVAPQDVPKALNQKWYRSE